MYTKFFGFSEKPFDVTPDPKFLYLNEAYREVLASLIYGIRERRGFITVVGEVGTGKTTLLNAVLDTLDEKTRVAYIFNTDVTFAQLLANILLELGLTQGAKTLTRQQALDRLNNDAIRQLSRGGNIALIVDEAQNLNNQTLENLRLLSNLETRKLKLIQIVLSGQPELDTKLNDPGLRQLAQRISLKRYLVPLNEEETGEYVQHRLRVAGCHKPYLFDRKARKYIWEYSGGIPRKISILCDNALLIAYGLKKRTITGDVVAEAIRDLSWSPFSGKKPETVTLPADMPRKIPDEQSSRVIFAGVVGIVAAACMLFLAGLWIGKNILFAPKEETVLSENLADTTGEKPPGAGPENIPESAAKKDSGDGAFDEEKPVLPLKKTAAAEAPAPETAIKKLPEPVKEAAKTPVETAAPVASSIQTSGRDPFKNPVPVEETVDGPGPEETVKKDLEKAPQKKELSEKVAVVRGGDTLYRIIVRNYGDYTGQRLLRVLKENPDIRDPDRIYVGQKIALPGEVKDNGS